MTVSIDRVQLYLGPVFTGGPVHCLCRNGAGSTKEALRLDRVRYERIGQDICVTGVFEGRQKNMRINFPDFAS